MGRWPWMSEPSDIRSLVAKLAESFGIPDAAFTARLFSSWAQIVGPQIASRCEPVALRDGVLKVKAATAAWASEVRYLSGQIAKRVNQEMGKELIREVIATGPEKAGGEVRPRPPRRRK